jgi:hypothetical protein
LENRRDSWDFFLAHSGADVGRTEVLYDLLATQAKVFLDSRTLRLGDDWDSSLTQAQKSALITVVLVSQNIEEAYYQREEIANAIAMAREDRTRHRVVPVYLDGLTPETTRIPYGLRLKHGLRIATDAEFDIVASRLLGLLAELTGRSLGPPEKAISELEPASTNAVATHPLTFSRESIVSQSAASLIRRGQHALHGQVLVKDLLTIPDESMDLVASRHYPALLGDRLIEVGRRDDGTLYELLREIPGHDLSTIVRKNNVIVGALLDDIALQVLQQLATLHGAPKPVIHRDVRPTNLILNFEPDDPRATLRTGERAGQKEVRYKAVVRLIDYDTACFDKDAQTPWGAHGFTAPEQREGQAVPASDLFALMSSLYFLATAVIPADARSWPHREMPEFDALFQGDFTEISEVYGHEALLRCWSYDVAKRPASAVAFLEERSVPGTRAIVPPKKLGTLLVASQWKIELFDTYYDVRPA